MSRRQKFWMYGGIAFVICVILVLLTAYGQGADPLHPRTRHIWLASLAAAAYVSFRGALIIEKFTDKDVDRTGNSYFWKFFTGWMTSGTGRRHAIDERMEARRQRVAAAKEKQAEPGNTSPSESSGAK